MSKTYDNLYGIFTGEECREYVDALVKRTEEQLAAYEKVKNASLRIRRAVLGEIKERKDGGGVYYTKPFRYLMNAVTVVNDFLKNVVKEEKSGVPAYFFRQILTFYSNAAYLAKKTEEICTDALSSLGELSATVEKELADVKRYKSSAGGAETYLFPERLAAKEELLAEIKKVTAKAETIGETNDAFAEFYAFLRGESTFAALGKGENFVDVLRYFYRETVKKYKLKYGMEGARALSFGSLRVVRASGGDGRRTGAPRIRLFSWTRRRIYPRENTRCFRKSMPARRLTYSEIWDRT